MVLTIVCNTQYNAAMNKKEFNDLYMNMTQELRRGSLVLATLSQLREKKYGYALIQSLSDSGLEVDQGTLYPLLRRLETQGLLSSTWDVEGARPRRYYVISADGLLALEALHADWEKLIGVMTKLLKNHSGKKE